MAEFNSSANEQTTELYLKKILPGRIEDVRRRVIASVETFGYDVIEDEPNILARRGSKGWGRWYGSADVLDYGSNLTVRLKELSESSTRVTFDYSIKHPTLNRGEQAIVAQEAKSIAALSRQQLIEKVCSVCETESTDDSRFCRNCGTPLTSEQAEREVLRLMAEARAAKTSVVATTLLVGGATILAIVLYILGTADLIKPKSLGLLIVFFGMALTTGTLFSGFGWNRLRRALSKPEESKIPTPSIVQPQIENAEYQELPPMRQQPASVTEGTTNLLEKEKVPVSKTTNELN